MGDAPNYEYILFVDEAGDVGTRTTAEGDKGSTEWFCLAGIVLARRYESLIPDWISGIKSQIADNTLSPELHYKTLDAEQRVSACAELSRLPLKAFVVASHKANMRGHRNPRAAKMSSNSAYYNFCLRILLERVTESVAKSSINTFGSKKKLRVVVAKTGAVRYSETKAYIEYLRHQARNQTTYLNAKVIDHDVLDIWQIDEVNANTVAGAQLADLAASAFYNALNPKGRNPHFLSPAIALRRAMATQYGKVAHHGLKLLPWDQKIPRKYRSVFEHYGYGWKD